MLIDNRDGLPRGDSDSPVLVTGPRGGIPAVIDTPEALSEAARALTTGTQPVALDVERAQGFRYGTEPWLVQVRREDVGTFLIDTHALPDLSVLTPGVDQVWLLHDAEQDLPNLSQVGLTPPSLFDTEVAAKLVGMDHFGLAAVCEQVLGLALVKDHQASDWSVRPSRRTGCATRRSTSSSSPSSTGVCPTRSTTSTAGSGRCRSSTT